MTVHRILAAAVFAIALPAFALAGQSSIPAAFADIGIGARAMGMGGANSVGAGRAVDVVWNPAALALVSVREIAVMQTEQFGLVPAYFVAYADSRDGGLGWGAALLSSGDALLRENTLHLAGGALLGDGLSLGAALKLRQARFGPEGDTEGVSGDALGAAVDIGVRGNVAGMELGLVLEEALGSIRWQSSVQGSYYESVPPTVTGGLRYGAGQLGFAADLELGLAAERAWKLAAGLEWTPHPVLALRGGLRQRLTAEESRFLGLGVGLGKDLEQGGRLQFDLAYLFHELDGSLRISASYRF